MITWIATQGCVSPVCVTLYAVCGIALLYFFYCCGCVEYSRQYWRALLSVNRVWRIYGREDSVKNLKYTISPKARKKDVIATFQTAESLQKQSSKINPHVVDMDDRVENNLVSNNNRRVNEVGGIDNPTIDLDDEIIQSDVPTTSQVSEQKENKLEIV